MEDFGKFQAAMLVTVENGSEGNRFHQLSSLFGVSHRHLWQLQLIESELRPRRWAGIPVTSGVVTPISRVITPFIWVVVSNIFYFHPGSWGRLPS